MPLLAAKKEVFAWLKMGNKTIDVRRGLPRGGETATFQCGTNHLRFHIIKTETGKLNEVIREDNFRQIIPSAENLEDAILYLCNLYGTRQGVFTAYYLSTP